LQTLLRPQHHREEDSEVVDVAENAVVAQDVVVEATVVDAVDVLLNHQWIWAPSQNWENKHSVFIDRFIINPRSPLTLLLQLFGEICGARESNVMVNLTRFSPSQIRAGLAHQIRKMHIVVYGGNGQLGKATVQGFKPHSITSVDGSVNDDADYNILIKFGDSATDQLQTCEQELEKVLGAHGTVDAIIVTAGGWRGGNAASGTS